MFPVSKMAEKMDTSLTWEEQRQHIIEAETEDMKPHLKRLVSFVLEHLPACYLVCLLAVLFDL